VRWPMKIFLATCALALFLARKIHER